MNREELLATCIIKSIVGRDFNWESFFKHWFRENGTPFYFLFKKNLSVTNTQFVELFSLLAIHSSCNFNSTRDTKLLFYTTEHIKTTFSEAVAALLENYTGDEKVIQRFSQRYINVFGATVAVDMFYGSCAVFIPHGIEIDVEKIVFDSGYIHSAGVSIFIRNIKKAKSTEFRQNIEDYLSKNTKGEIIPFVAYSHEDFSAFDKEYSDLMDKGIEQCKIHLEKMSMGSERLSSIINDLSSTFKDRLFVPQPGDYREVHKFKKGKSVWLISDKSISSTQLRNPGTGRYYICYEQFLKDDSPFFFFDENKPAWKSHTTMPHSLTAALVNASRPLAKGSLIRDPFGGTGTTWFEVKRIRLDNSVMVSDLSPAASLLLEDNYRFFRMSSDEMKKMRDTIKACVPAEISTSQVLLNFEGEGIIDPYKKVKDFIEQLKNDQPNEEQEFTLNDEFVNNLKSLSPLTRILFYIGLRAQLRFQSAFKRKAVTFEAAFKKSQDKMIEQIQMYINLKSEVEEQLAANTDQTEAYIKSKGNYSYKLTPTSVFLGEMEELKNEVINSLDARNLNPNSCELIICDPPYGFNTIEDEEQLANLYSEFLDKAIAALIPNGQLIMCLPSESFTGKNLPYCTRSDLVSRQILIKAHNQNRTVFSTSKSLPTIGFSPPYYWESDKALRRSILHFRFQ